MSLDDFIAALRGPASARYTITVHGGYTARDGKRWSADRRATTDRECKPKTYTAARLDYIAPTGVPVLVAREPGATRASRLVLSSSSVLSVVRS